MATTAFARQKWGIGRSDYITVVKYITVRGENKKCNLIQCQYI